MTEWFDLWWSPERDLAMLVVAFGLGLWIVKGLLR